MTLVNLANLVILMNYDYDEYGELVILMNSDYDEYGDYGEFNDSNKFIYIIAFILFIEQLIMMPTNWEH